MPINSIWITAINLGLQHDIYSSDFITFNLADLDSPDVGHYQKKTKTERQMKLAMDWDLIELAEEYIKFNFQVPPMTWSQSPANTT